MWAVAVSAPRHISILRIFFAYLGTLTSSPMSSLKFTVPSLAELHTEVEKKFQVLPCIFQARVALAQLKQKDCITISPTGSGKTLTFWIPLLFNNDGIIIIVTALNILGDKNVAELEKLDISALGWLPCLLHLYQSCQPHLLLRSHPDHLLSGLLVLP